MIRTTWGVSTINGSAEVMKYAPEALYGVNSGSGNWIEGQWYQEKNELKAKALVVLVVILIWLSFLMVSRQEIKAMRSW